MRLGVGRVLRVDQPLSSGDSHTAGQLGVWNAMAAINVCQSLSQVSQSAREVVSGSLQEFDC